MKDFLKRNAFLKIIAIYIVFTLLVPFLANEKPIYCKYRGENYFPIFNFQFFSNEFEKFPETKNQFRTDLKKIKFEKVVWPLIPYSPGKPDINNLNGVGPFDVQQWTDQSGQKKEIPFRFRHWLGTNPLGSDLLSDLLHSLKNVFLLNILTALLSCFFGIVIGSYMGLQNSKKLKFKLIHSILIVFLLFTFFQTLNQLNPLSLSTLIIVIWPIGLFILCKSFFKKIIENKLNYFGPIIEIEFDQISLFIFNFFYTLPPILLIMIFLKLELISFWSMILFLSLFPAIDIARVIRSGIVQFKNSHFIESANALGVSEYRLIIFHFLPQMRDELIFTVLSILPYCIILEGSLSYLGIGIRPDDVSLGKLILEYKLNLGNWWMLIFPGLLIFSLLILTNLLVYKLKSRRKTSL